MQIQAAIFAFLCGRARFWGRAGAGLACALSLTLAACAPAPSDPAPEDADLPNPPLAEAPAPQSPETEPPLNLIEDEDLERAILGYVDRKLEGRQDEAYKIVTALPKGFQTVYTTWWVETEVYLGGFNQYFWNTSGEFALEAIEGFKAIGAPEAAAILEDALVAAVAELPEMRNLPQGAVAARPGGVPSRNTPSLSELDEKFYDQSRELSDLRIKYIRRNPGFFIAN